MFGDGVRTLEMFGFEENDNRDSVSKSLKKKLLSLTRPLAWCCEGNCSVL